jgi:hypothetical protein
VVAQDSTELGISRQMVAVVPEGLFQVLERAESGARNKSNLLCLEYLP